MNIKIIKSLGILGVLVVVGLWLISGIYTVDSTGGEKAVVLRFGKHARTVSKAGLHWHIPLPIETIIKEKVDEPKRLEFGFVTEREGTTQQPASYRGVEEQSLMLTGDENMVNVDVAVQYIITDIEDYLFNVDDQTETLKIATESAIRRAIASHMLDEVLTVNKDGIARAIQEDLQEICNIYEMGVGITAVKLQDVDPPIEVDDAFKDVANAREDKTSFINEAESYRNEIIPNARGNAAEMLNKAEAYKEKRTAEAKGDVANFVQILEKYQQGKEVTRIRMYLETLEEVLPGVEKYIVNEDGNTVKFLPLQENIVLPKKEE